jgi:general secretion pathway protein J
MSAPRSLRSHSPEGRLGPTLGSGPALARVRGFTLAEVLVALALMALLATISWRGVTSMTEAKQSADARVDETLRMGTVLAQWEQDLQQVHDTALVPSLAFDGASLRLVRRQPDGVQIVTWSLRESRWQRWASPMATSAQGLQDAWLASQQLLGNEPGQLTLFEGLGGWQIYFYRNNAWTNAQSSGDLLAPSQGASAPQVARSRLPDGVRVVLTLAGSGEGDIGRTITRDILVPPQLP